MARGHSAAQKTRGRKYEMLDVENIEHLYLEGIKERYANFHFIITRKPRSLEDELLAYSFPFCQVKSLILPDLFSGNVEKSAS